MQRFAKVATPSFPADAVNALAFSPDSVLLAVGTDDGQVCVYDHQSEQLVYRIVGDSPTTAVMWHPADRYTLFIGGGNGTCTVYQFDASNFVSRLVSLQHDVNAQ